jgi:hypothetical protein
MSDYRFRVAVPCRPKTVSAVSCMATGLSRSLALSAKCHLSPVYQSCPANNKYHVRVAPRPRLRSTCRLTPYYLVDQHRALKPPLREPPTYPLHSFHPLVRPSGTCSHELELSPSQGLT